MVDDTGAVARCMPLLLMKAAKIKVKGLTGCGLGVQELPAHGGPGLYVNRNTNFVTRLV